MTYPTGLGHIWASHLPSARLFNSREYNPKGFGGWWGGTGRGAGCHCNNGSTGKWPQWRCEGERGSSTALWLHLQGNASCFLSAYKRRRHLCQVKQCFSLKAHWFGRKLKNIFTPNVLQGAWKWRLAFLFVNFRLLQMTPWLCNSVCLLEIF